MNTRFCGTVKNNSVKVDTGPSTVTTPTTSRRNLTTTTSVPRVLSLAADIDDPASTTASVDHLFQPSSMCASPKQRGMYFFRRGIGFNLISFSF
jgi:hypothetical protein